MCACIRAAAWGMVVLWAWSPAAAGAKGAKKARPYRLPSANIRQQILWSAECRTEGGGLAFGGMDQESDDGRPHTRVLIDGQWRAIHAELRAANPLQALHARTWALRNRTKSLRARARRIYFRGLNEEEERAQVGEQIRAEHDRLAEDLEALTADVGRAAKLGEYEKRQVAFALKHAGEARALWCGPARCTASVAPAALQAMRRAQVHLALAAEALDAEPPPRALSPVAYDARTKLFVLFGGDHLDYLTNDTWVFDPAKRRWFQRHPPAAPSPRANHALRADGDGRVVLSGGYHYVSNTDYCGGQYVDVEDGEHVYDVAADAWKGPALVEPDARTYRTGPFHPDFYLQGDKPDAAAFEAKLKALPANRWVATDPPCRPRLNRDWGTAVIDTDRDMMLRWSGGHSAHGGTDVPHFHFATNRWELAYPVEFPLGQLYSNTSYPKGVNFNLRPGMTGHTYQDYAYDPLSRKMIQTGHPDCFYVYDPDEADWVGRAAKPEGMNYRSCFYTLTLCTTPTGIVCWTRNAELYLYRPQQRCWTPMKTVGDALPPAMVDNSTLAYDSRRGRIVFFQKQYGKKPYEGQVHALDLKAGRVAALSPQGAAGAGRIAWIDRCCYDPDNDLVLMATYLQPGTEWTATPAYDCAANRWITLDLAYPVQTAGNRVRRAYPHGHSAGIMYDPRRKLIWGTDTNSQVYVLKLDAKAANPRPLE